MPAAPDSPTGSSARTRGRHARRSRTAPVLLAGGMTLSFALLDTAALTGAASAGGSTAQFERLAGCESGGNWSINTGNGYYGGIQFDLPTWRGLGFSGYPHQASKATQIAAGQKLQGQRGWSPWPACSRKLGLSGGGNSGSGQAAATPAKTKPKAAKATPPKATPAKPKATPAKATPAKPKATPAKPKATPAKPKATAVANKAKAGSATTTKVQAAKTSAAKTSAAKSSAAKSSAAKSAAAKSSAAAARQAARESAARKAAARKARIAAILGLRQTPAPAFDGPLSTADRATYRESVRQWQLRMSKRGWTISVDGHFGPQSAAVAKAYLAGLKAQPGAPALTTAAGTVDAQIWRFPWTTKVRL